MFVSTVAAVDGAAWYQQCIAHGAELDAQVFVDALGQLAFLHAVNLGNFAVGIELSEQSRQYATEHQLEDPGIAWLAAAFAAMFTGDQRAALHAAERALAAAEARGAEQEAVLALCAMVNPLAASGEFERTVEVAAEAVRRAEHLGQPGLIVSSVVSTAHTHLANPAGLDFVSCLDVLNNHQVEPFGDTTDTMWLDATWGVAEVGLQRPGAVGHLVQAARVADQLHALHALDLVLRYLAVVAAEAGLVEDAHALVAYSDANLRPYRMDNPIQHWVQDRLGEALAGLPAASPSAASPRGEIMRRITEIEAELS